MGGYIRKKGRKLVDATGRQVLLHGVNLGNWMQPEGYIWGFTDTSGRTSARQIADLTKELVGPERSDRFWKAYRAAWITEDDLRMIARMGFDHVRLPFDARVMLGVDGQIGEEGWSLLDRVVDWAADSGLYVILDMHGAPGGQSGGPVDDSVYGRPDLFLDPATYWPQAISMWRTIAARYADNPAVLGYDLLNEPLPTAYSRFNGDLLDFYRRVTEAIRQVDNNHVLIYEGPDCDNDLSVFTEVLDENSVLQFHRYMKAPERASFQEFIDVASRLDLPLYMGELGENSPDWVYGMIRTAEDLGIGWCLWTWKKFDTPSAPVNAAWPEGWKQVAAYGNGQAGRPSSDQVAETLNRIVKASQLGSCSICGTYLNATLGKAPISLPAWAFSRAILAEGREPATAPSGFRSETGVRFVFAPFGPAPSRWSLIGNRTPLADHGVDVLLQPGDRLIYRVAGARKVRCDPPAGAECSCANGLVTVEAREEVLLHRLSIE